MTSQTVRVDLGKRAYDIIVGEGVFAKHTDLLREKVAKGQVAVVTDDNVNALHGDLITKSFGKIPVISLPPGEQTKSYKTYTDLIERLIAAGIGRDGTIIAFGGGVIGDLAGFAAATLRRGCQFIQVPTTLLAQVDSSVGGKTAINSPQGKNLVGAFYQPSLVLADTNMLNTLPDRELRAGYAEVIKYGLINDLDFFSWLETNGSHVLAQDENALTTAVATCCRAKATIVKHDETEQGQRALLNLGHTFGHALETAMGYDGRLLHGEAVAVGLAMAFRYCAQHGLCPEGDSERVERLIRESGLPSRLQHIEGFEATTDDLMAFIAQDKKVESGSLTFIFTRGIGDSYVALDVDPTDIQRFLTQELLSSS